MAVIHRHETMTSIGVEPGKTLFIGMLLIDDLAHGVVWGEADDEADFRRQVAERYDGTAHPVVDLALQIEIQNQGILVIDNGRGSAIM